jgi:hypothetical protein
MNMRFEELIALSGRVEAGVSLRHGLDSFGLVTVGKLKLQSLFK